jgi:hypothetical protein
MLIGNFAESSNGAKLGSMTVISGFMNGFPNEWHGSVKDTPGPKRHYCLLGIVANLRESLRCLVAGMCYGDSKSSSKFLGQT